MVFIYGPFQINVSSINSVAIYNVTYRFIHISA
jgi:hypothetical protein